MQKKLLVLLLIQKICGLGILIGPHIAHNEDETIKSFLLYEHLEYIFENRIKILLDLNFEYLRNLSQLYIYRLENKQSYIYFVLKKEKYGFLYSTEKMINTTSEIILFAEFKLQTIHKGFNKYKRKITLFLLFHTIDFFFVFQNDLQLQNNEIYNDIYHNFLLDFFYFFGTYYDFIKSYDFIGKKENYKICEQLRYNECILNNRSKFKKEYFILLEKYILKCFKSYYRYKKNKLINDIYNFKIKCCIPFLFYNYMYGINCLGSNKIGTKDIYLKINNKDSVQIYDFKVPYFSVDSIIILLYSILNEHPTEMKNLYKKENIDKIYIDLDNSIQFYDYVFNLFKDILSKKNIKSIPYDIEKFLIKLFSLLIKIFYLNFNFELLNPIYKKERITYDVKNEDKIKIAFLFDTNAPGNLYLKYSLNKNISMNNEDIKTICDLICDSYVLYQEIFAEQIYRYIKRKKVQAFIFENLFCAKIKNQNIIQEYIINDQIKGLKISNKESSYLLCEKQAKILEKIKNLVLKHFYDTIEERNSHKHKNCLLSLGELSKNWNYDEIIRKLPKFVKNHK